MSTFEIDAALLWQQILCLDRAKLFAGFESAAIDRPHGFDRLPQPGFVGNRYRLDDGIVLVGKNPANGGDGMSPGDIRQYQLLKALCDATADNVYPAFRHLMAALGTTVMPCWPIVQVVVTPLLNGLRLSLDDVAYINLCKFRTSDMPPRGLLKRSWPVTLQQIELLRPSAIVALGDGTHGELLRHYNGGVRVFRIQRVRRDTRLPPQGKRDIEQIVTALRTGVSTVDFP